MTDERQTDRTPREIADEHNQIVEFGRAIKLLRDTADELERNGHTTVSALEAGERLEGLLNTVAREEGEIRQYKQERVKELVDDGMDRDEAIEEVMYAE